MPIDLPPPVECVVLLHGLGRTSRSMAELETFLQAEGYAVANVDYPSRKHPVESLAIEAVGRGLGRCREMGAEKIHFVTHSLGGILVRYYLSQRAVPDIGRVVMLGPPNHGTGIVDVLARVPGFNALAGPAAIQLGTQATSIPNSLGPISCEAGVVAGSWSINPLFSMLLAGPDDGLVPVESTHVEGMRDFTVVRTSHTFVMRNPRVLDLTLSFLRTGRFS